MGDTQSGEMKENGELAHFCQSLDNKMAKANEQLLEQCKTITAQTDELRARMTLAMNNVYSPSDGFPQVVLAQRIMEKNRHWIQTIVNGIEQAQQRLVLLTASTNDWYTSVEQRAETLLGGDELTMLPYNDVLHLCGDLKAQTEDCLKEANTAWENAENVTIADELEQLQLDTFNLVAFEDEMRLEKQKLNMIIAEKNCKRRQSFIFKSGLQFRKVENLKLAIAELEAKITQVESNLN